MPEPLPSVLLLDLDDTILDDTGAREECWRVACAEAAEARPGLDPEALRREVERAREVFWSDPERHREWRPRMREAWGRIACEARMVGDNLDWDVSRVQAVGIRGVC